MDGYRCCVLNKDSFLEVLNSQPEGKKEFLKQYYKLLNSDRRLKTLIRNSNK
jgi:hypothetical protein